MRENLNTSKYYKWKRLTIKTEEEKTKNSYIKHNSPKTHLYIFIFDKH